MLLGNGEQDFRDPFITLPHHASYSSWGSTRSLLLHPVLLLTHPQLTIYLRPQCLDALPPTNASAHLSPLVSFWVYKLTDSPFQRPSLCLVYDHSCLGVSWYSPPCLP